MRDCMLVNPSGCIGHWLAIDMNIEHLIRYLKVHCLDTLHMLTTLTIDQFLFAAKGLYASWDRLGDISAAVDYLQKIKKQVGIGLGRYGGTTHTTPDTSDLVWKVANKVKELELQIFKLQRQGHDNDTVKPVVDILAAGEQKLKSASLATFNKKVHTLINGHSVEEEVDEIPGVDYGDPIDNDDDGEDD